MCMSPWCTAEDNTGIYYSWSWCHMVSSSEFTVGNAHDRAALLHLQQLTQNNKAAQCFTIQREDRSHNRHFIPTISEHVEVASVSFIAQWSLWSSRSAR